MIFQTVQLGHNETSFVTKYLYSILFDATVWSYESYPQIFQALKLILMSTQDIKQTNSLYTPQRDFESSFVD
jgi:hypothetical protein